MVCDVGVGKIGVHPIKEAILIYRYGVVLAKRTGI